MRPTDQGFYTNHIKTDLGEKEPSEIGPLDARRIQKTMEKNQLKPQTIKHVLALIVRLSNHAEREQLCQGITFKVDFPAFDNRKTEDLTDDQLSHLLSAIDQDENFQAANLMRMVLFTGMRRGELFKLEWEHINFDRGFIEIVDPKGKKNQKIPLNLNP